jgi:hypothetical protein
MRKYLRSIVPLVVALTLSTASDAFANGWWNEYGHTAQHHWAGNGYYLASGQNGFSNYYVYVYTSEGEGENRAVCAGIRGVGSTCVGRGYTASYGTGAEWYKEVYLHNHDTEGGYF